MRMLTAVALIGAAACCDSATGPTTTTQGEFELSVEHGTMAEWTQEVELPEGTQWTSARYMSCTEYRAISLPVGPCESATVRLSGRTMTFSGRVGGEFTDQVRVRWEAEGR